MIERYITDIVGEVVTATATALSNSIHYEFGDMNEVVMLLSKMSLYKQSAEKKYPLVAMFTDIPENRGRATHIQSEITIPSIIIATFTSQKYTAKERMEKSIKPILQPIYDELLKQFKLHQAVDVAAANLIVHQKINRLSWGQSALFQENNAGTDFIDAIEIRNLELKVKTKKC
jgi:hypothetical protein